MAHLPAQLVQLRRELQRAFQEGPEAVLLRAMRYPPSHDFEEGPAPAQLVLQVRALRPAFFVCLLATVSILATLVWSMIDGWRILRREEIPVKCTPLRYWLTAYDVAMTLLPLTLSFIAAIPISLIGIATGRLVRSMVPTSCERQAPQMWAFVDACGIQGLVSVAGLALMGMCAMWAAPRVQQIEHQWGQEGSAVEELIELVTAGPPPEVGAESECAICLAEAGLASDWRALRCGHQFHEECLVQWLRMRPRCPLCRLDLRRAYGPGLLGMDGLPQLPEVPEEDGQLMDRRSSSDISPAA